RQYDEIIVGDLIVLRKVKSVRLGDRASRTGGNASHVRVQAERRCSAGSECSVYPVAGELVCDWSSVHVKQLRQGRRPTITARGCNGPVERRSDAAGNRKRDEVVDGS